MRAHGVAGFVSFFLIVILYGEYGGGLLSHPGRTAWMCWTLPLCIEPGALSLGVELHEKVQLEELAKRTASGRQRLGDQA